MYPECSTLSRVDTIVMICGWLKQLQVSKHQIVYTDVFGNVSGVCCKMTAKGKTDF